MSEDPTKYKILTPKDKPKDEIDWDTVTEEQLFRRAAIFSYEIKDARKRLKAKEEWIKFIVAHLYLDHIITQILTENLKNSKAFSGNDRRKYLLDKLEICDAMGWIDPAIIPIIKKLNNIRNKMSHQLSFSVSEKDVSDFKSCFGTDFQDILINNRKDDKRKSLVVPTYKYLELILILADQSRQQTLHRKYLTTLKSLKMRDAMLNARKVLEETRRSET